MADDDLPVESMAIETRADFVQGAIERSRAIVPNKSDDLTVSAEVAADDQPAIGQRCELALEGGAGIAIVTILEPRMGQKTHHGSLAV